MTTPTLTLTPEFTEGLERLERGDNLFLTGRAGTGKSTLIRQFLANTNRNVVVAAPTGIAALNVEGYTIHRLFSFWPGVTVEHVRSAKYFPSSFVTTLRQLDTLILDEASMVRADLFDCLAVALERFGPQRGTPFGGVQLVLVGDLFQLPPVVTEGEKPYFEQRYASPYFFSADHYDRDQFPLVELTTVFRQIGDTRLVEILNEVREGALLDTARAELNKRTDSTFRPPVDEFWLTLTTTNRIADARNREMLTDIAGPELTYQAVVIGDMDSFDRPAAQKLVYKVGAQIMLLTNDPMDRWVNGTIGRIRRHRLGEAAPVVTVDLPNGIEVDVTPHTWEVTRPVIENGALRHEVIGSYTQLPFQLAWAITIHKSQGQTLDRLVVDLSGGTFADGQLYVALSRCTSMDGLVLKREVLPRDLKTDQRIRRFLMTSRPPRNSRGYVYLGICTVGDEGRMWRPRPVEIALVTDDGTELTTLINPARDLGDARTTYGITALDLQLAPSLAEAWPVLAPHLADRTPVGVDIDDQLRNLDYELKRHDRVVAMPLGVELDTRGRPTADVAWLAAPQALERARAARAIARRQQSVIAAPLDTFASAPEANGYLLTRGSAPDCLQTNNDSSHAKSVLHEHFQAKLRGVHLDERTRALLLTLECHFGRPFFVADDDDDAGGGGGDIRAVLQPGVRVCFTGNATDDSGREWQRGELTELAQAHGLKPVPTVTKKRCDALIAGEAGTMSGKGRKAAEYGKPVFTANEFLAWTVGQDIR
ncbi:AAA family ATPase [Nocardia sp. NPDC056952]|uniref:AAA family ATPase n=1 Tax=Nocardia sp. NPDC056952 TaxID=3345979 RepID=UPI003640733B